MINLLIKRLENGFDPYHEELDDEELEIIRDRNIAKARGTMTPEQQMLDKALIIAFSKREY